MVQSSLHCTHDLLGVCCVVVQVWTPSQWCVSSLGKQCGSAPGAVHDARSGMSLPVQLLLSVSMLTRSDAAGLQLPCRHGQCTKGFKCKYSHDLGVERKTAKIDLFTDQRDLGKEEGEEVRDNRHTGSSSTRTNKQQRQYADYQAQCSESKLGLWCDLNLLHV